MQASFASAKRQRLMLIADEAGELALRTAQISYAIELSDPRVPSVIRGLDSRLLDLSVPPGVRRVFGRTQEALEVLASVVSEVQRGSQADEDVWAGIERVRVVGRWATAQLQSLCDIADSAAAGPA